MQKPEYPPEYHRLLNELRETHCEAGDAYSKLTRIKDKNSPEYFRIRINHKALCDKAEQMERRASKFVDEFSRQIRAYKLYETEENKRQKRQAVVDAEWAKAEQARTMEQVRHAAKLAEQGRLEEETERKRQHQAEEAEKKRTHEEKLKFLAIKEKQLELELQKEQRLAAEAAREAAAHARKQDNEQISAMLKSLKDDES